jgi:hypothetical protein
MVTEAINTAKAAGARNITCRGDSAFGNGKVIAAAVNGGARFSFVLTKSRLRASGMPLPAIRRYTDLVRQGAGNEEQRLTLLREHQQQVTTQIGQLTQCLDLISFKVRVYEDVLAQGTTDHLCDRMPVE